MASHATSSGRFTQAADAVHTSFASQSCFHRNLNTTAAVRNRMPLDVPSFGDTSFASGRWTRSTASHGLNVFDLRGAIAAIENGPDASEIRKMHPAAIAHGSRVARAQQMSATLWGFKVFPDLTPGRAFMWGSILAVYGVVGTAYLTTRALNINSADDMRDRMQAMCAPLKEALQTAAGKDGSRIRREEFAETPTAIKQFCERLRLALAGPAAVPAIHPRADE